VHLASLVAAGPSKVSQADFRLPVIPANIYKVDDPGGARTSSFVFNVAVICSTDCARADDADKGFMSLMAGAAIDAARLS
jgi:hypothetical protein